MENNVIKCRKCNGAGKLPRYISRHGGICYGCNGHGYTLAEHTAGSAGSNWIARTPLSRTELIIKWRDTQEFKTLRDSREDLFGHQMDYVGHFAGQVAHDLEYNSLADLLDQDLIEIKEVSK